MFVREENLVFDKEMSDIIGKTNFETYKNKTKAPSPVWCHKTTRRVTWQLFLAKLTAFVSSQKRADKATEKTAS